MTLEVGDMKLVLEDVGHAPDFRANLISGGQLMEEGWKGVLDSSVI